MGEKEMFFIKSIEEVSALPLRLSASFLYYDSLSIPDVKV